MMPAGFILVFPITFIDSISLLSLQDHYCHWCQPVGRGTVEVLCFATLWVTSSHTYHQIKLFSEKQLFEGHLRVIMVAAAFILDCLLTITAVVGFLFNIYTLVSILFSKQVSYENPRCYF